MWLEHFNRHADLYRILAFNRGYPQSYSPLFYHFICGDLEINVMSMHITQNFQIEVLLEYWKLSWSTLQFGSLECNVVVNMIKFGVPDTIGISGLGSNTFRI